MTPSAERGADAVSLRYIALACAAFGALALLLPPWNPGFASDTLDSSWDSGLALALRGGEVFGRDVLFTHGPLGFLASHRYWPGLFWPTIAFWLLIALTFALLAAQIAVRLGWPTLLLAAAVPFMLQRTPGAIAVLTAVMVVASALARPRSATLLVAAVAFGVIATTKFTYGVMGLGALAAIAAGGLASGRRDQVALLPLALVAFLSTWVAAGQPLTAVPAFVANNSEIASGFGWNNQVEGSSVEAAWIALTIVVANVTLAMLLAPRRDAAFAPRARWAAAVVGLLWVAFITWKQAVTRHDGHALVVVAYAVALVVLAAAIAMAGHRSASPRERIRSAGMVALSAVSCAVVVAIVVRAHLGQSVWELVRDLGQTASKRVQSVASIASLEPRLHARHDEALARIRRAWPLPPLEGAVDGIPSDVDRIAASGLAWRPRPTVQSHVAYTAALAQLNAAHYESARAPRYVLFDARPIDGRLASLEDARLWSVLVRDYRPAYFEPMLILERRQKPLPESTAGVRARPDGLRVELPSAETAGYIRAQIAYMPGMWDRIRATLFRPEPMMIDVQLVSGETRRFRYIPGAGDAGFIVSPLVESAMDFAGLLCDCDAFDARKWVKSIAFETAAGVPLRTDAFEFRFDHVKLDHAGDGAIESSAPAVARMVPLEAPPGPPLIFESGRLARNAHAPSKFSVSAPTITQICFGIRNGAWERREFDGVEFIVTARGSDGADAAVLDDVLHPTTGTVTSQRMCRAVPDTLRGAALTLTTRPVGTAAYDWAYWYFD